MFLEQVFEQLAQWRISSRSGIQPDRLSGTAPE